MVNNDTIKRTNSLYSRFLTSRITSIGFAIASNGEPYIQFKYNNTDYYQLTFKPSSTSVSQAKIELGKSVNGTWSQLWVLYS